MLWSLQEGQAPVSAVGGKASSLMKLYSSRTALQDGVRYLPESSLVPQKRSAVSCLCFIGCCMRTVGYKVSKQLDAKKRLYFKSPNATDEDPFNRVELGQTVSGTMRKGWLEVKGTFSTESNDGISSHVPSGFALSVDFFNPWVEQVVTSKRWKEAEPKLVGPEAVAVCNTLKEFAKALPLTGEQSQVLKKLQTEISSWPNKLAAVRSSAPEEDGAGSSFAGVFETKLGVTPTSLEDAVRECFCSVFDYRVFSYAGAHKPSFAAVVMEMVDSYKAGVAFSANPLNSDLDEILIDSSWGLGESVVDGSVVADRFIWDKVAKTQVLKTVGSKAQERKLKSDGGVEIRPVAEERQAICTLSDAELTQLANLVAAVEATYGIPMDTEWAFTEDGKLRLLQARPITTIHPLEPSMLTAPGERRALYWDPNIASEATTTSPFTYMDNALYADVTVLAMGFQGKLTIPEDSNSIFFSGSNRQYLNLSHLLSIPGVDSSVIAKEEELLDGYLAALLYGDECSDAKYKSKRLPEDMNCRNGWSLLRKLPLCDMMTVYKKFQDDPTGANKELKEARDQFKVRITELIQKGPANGLASYTEDCFQAARAMVRIQMGGLWTALAVWKELDEIRRNGKTQKEKDDADALLGGFEGDPLVEMNVAMYSLAQKLPSKVWEEYKDKLSDLAGLIDKNIKGQSSALPAEFISSWKDFMDKYGFDGNDQIFVSSPRYHEQPEMLLAKLRMNAGDVKDPNQSFGEKVQKRKEVQDAQLAAAGCWSRSSISKRNKYLDEILWVRQAPKLSYAQVYDALRRGVLSCAQRLVDAGRLDDKNDIFHLGVPEVDRMLNEPGFNGREIIAPRKKRYLLSKSAKSCPFLIDSRSRILKPNVVKSEPGTLVGAPISPGRARGIVRVLDSPTDKLEPGEVLATVLTDPAWTPLFVGCSAVILQIGGALQHGALCAREYGKPAVSNIDVTAELKTGMEVEVNGDTGVVTILTNNPKRRASRHLSSKDLEN